MKFIQTIKKIMRCSFIKTRIVLSSNKIKKPLYFLNSIFKYNASYLIYGGVTKSIGFVSHQSIYFLPSIFYIKIINLEYFPFKLYILLSSRNKYSNPAISDIKQRGSDTIC